MPPKAEDIQLGPSWFAPPPPVASKLGSGSAWLVGIDLETNDWETTRGIKGTFGQFGHYSLCAPCDLEARIVQLGWAYGPAGCQATVKERLVRPEGFRISAKAEQFHKTSHGQAVGEGLPLADVLVEFMADLTQLLADSNARLVCHHLEFDAGIISQDP